MHPKLGLYNRFARLALNRKVGGSIPPGGVICKHLCVYIWCSNQKRLSELNNYKFVMTFTVFLIHSRALHNTKSTKVVKIAYTNKQMRNCPHEFI